MHRQMVGYSFLKIFDDTSENVSLRHHQLERPILSNFYLSPSRDAADDLFQHTLNVLTGITMG